MPFRTRNKLYLPYKYGREDNNINPSPESAENFKRIERWANDLSGMNVPTSVIQAGSSTSIPHNTQTTINLNTTTHLHDQSAIASAGKVLLTAGDGLYDIIAWASWTAFNALGDLKLNFTVLDPNAGNYGNVGLTSLITTPGGLAGTVSPTHSHSWIISAFNNSTIEALAYQRTGGGSRSLSDMVFRIKYLGAFNGTTA